MGIGKVTNIRRSALFPRLGKYPQLTSICQVRQSWEHSVKLAWRKEKEEMLMVTIMLVGRDSSVDIAARYGLDGPGIESRWGARFFPPVQTGLGAQSASYKMGTGSFPMVKRLGGPGVA